jgi:hypothetical protein
MLTYKPLTNSSRNRVRKYLINKPNVKKKIYQKVIQYITITRLYTGGTGTESMYGVQVNQVNL